MRKTNFFILAILFLSSCTPTPSSEASSSSSESKPSSILSTQSSETSASPEIIVSLKELMSVYQAMGNYTYTVTDEVFSTTTKLRYTKYAYFYEVIEGAHGGENVGYAENKTGVFTYTIQKEGQVEMGQYLTDKTGNYVHNMWFTTIVSFLDLSIGDLPDEAEEGHRYHIVDQLNKLLISSLCGLGDTYLQEYIDVYIEITSNSTFRTIVHTSGLPNDYNGYIYGDISEVGTTEIPEIQTILDQNGGPTQLDAELVDFLKKLVQSKNYTITMTGTNEYEDLFTVRNYYSKNVKDDASSKGYASSSDGVFPYRIVDNQIVPGEAISNGSGGVFDSIWNGLPNFYSFASLNLARLEYQKEGDTYRITSSSIIYTFAMLSHVNESIAAEEGNTLTITLGQNELTYHLTLPSLGEIQGRVHNIDATSIPLIEQYIQDGHGPLVYGDIDQKAKELLLTLSKCKNYTLDIVSTFKTNSFHLTKKFTSTIYHEEKENGPTQGYIEKDSGVYQFTKQDNVYTLGEKVKEEGTFLWASDLFKGFNRLKTSSLTGKKIADNEYTITDSDNKNAICEIAGFGIYDLMFYIQKISFKIIDESLSSLEFTIDLGTYGSVKMSLIDVNNTTLDIQL